jgi:hypothetical protein
MTAAQMAQFCADHAADGIDTRVYTHYGKPSVELDNGSIELTIRFKTDNFGALLGTLREYPSFFKKNAESAACAAERGAL